MCPRNRHRAGSDGGGGLSGRTRPLLRVMDNSDPAVSPLRRPLTDAAVSCGLFGKDAIPERGSGGGALVWPTVAAQAPTADTINRCPGESRGLLFQRSAGGSILPRLRLHERVMR